VKYKIDINGIHICYYLADFVYVDRLMDKTIVEDVKGMKRGAAYQMFKLKAKLMKACYGIDILES
jgi:hypothetical protein